MHRIPAAALCGLLAVGAYTLTGCFAGNPDDGLVTAPKDTTPEIPAMPGLSWTWRNPMPQGNTLLSIAKSPACWVMTGENGSLVRSTDGEHWTLVNSWQTFSDVIWAQGRFTAVGGAEVWTSQDGLTWNSQSLSFTVYSSYYGNGLRRIVWTGSLYIAVGGDFEAVIFTSPDGYAWTRRTATGAGLRAVAWSGNLAVAVGEYKNILTSPNGVTWTDHSLDGVSFHLNDVVWTGSQFVLAGGQTDYGFISTSPDGIVWTGRTLSFWNLVSLLWTGSRLVAAPLSGGKLLTSLDGVAWTESFPVGDLSPKRLAKAGNEYFMLGEDGLLQTSQDGLTWVSKNGGVRKSLSSVVWTGTQAVIVGDSGLILTSADGIQWTSRTSGTNKPLNAVTWNGLLLVAVGAGGTLLTSPDGLTWTMRPTGTTNNLVGVAASKTGALMAVGDGGNVLFSSNGEAWSFRKVADDTYLQSVLAADSLWLVGGLQGKIWTSADGLAWTQRSTGEKGPVASMAWNGRKYMIGTTGFSDFYDGSILTSEDAAVWQKMPGELAFTAWTGTYWVGIPDIGKYPIIWAEVFVSATGANWSRMSVHTYSRLRSLAWTGTTLIAVGSGGAILTSP
jgi:hypothetical protein